MLKFPKIQYQTLICLLPLLSLKMFVFLQQKNIWKKTGRCMLTISSCLALSPHPHPVLEVPAEPALSLLLCALFIQPTRVATQQSTPGSCRTQMPMLKYILKQRYLDQWPALFSFFLSFLFEPFRNCQGCPGCGVANCPEPAFPIMFFGYFCFKVKTEVFIAEQSCTQYRFRIPTAFKENFNWPLSSCVILNHDFIAMMVLSFPFCKMKTVSHT